MSPIERCRLSASKRARAGSTRSEWGGTSTSSHRGSRYVLGGVGAPRRHSFRFSIGWKFVLLVAAVVPSLVGVSLVAAAGVTEMKAQLDRVHRDNLASTQVVARMSDELLDAEVLARRLLIEPDAEVSARLRVHQRQQIAIRVHGPLAELRRLWAGEPDNLALIDELDPGWESFLTYTSSPDFLAARATTRSAASERQPDGPSPRNRRPVAGVIVVCAAHAPRG